MKNQIKILLLPVILVICFSFRGYSDDIKVPSKITHVTVYRQKAKITQVATAFIPAGPSTIVLEKLSDNIDPNTIQVSASSPARVISVNFRTNYLENTDISKMMKLLQDSLDNLDYQLDWVRDQKSVLEGEEKLIEGNNQVYSTQQGVIVANLQGLVEYYGKRLLEIKNEILKLNIDDKRFSEKISRIQNEINQYNSNKTIPVGEIVLEMASPNQLNVEIEFSYIVNTAGWVPLYEIRSEGTGKPVTLVYKANVHQSSGFDWTNVALTLSTGNPAVNNNIPVFFPRYLSFYMPAPTYREYNNNLYQKDEAEKAPAAMNKKEVYKESDFEQETVITEHQINVEFDVPLKYNIPSDGMNHLISMKDYSMNATYEYYSIPDRDKGAFLVAKIPDWGKLNLLAGKANLFFENSYIGQSDINPNSTLDTLMVSFGRDEKVVVKREKATDYTTIKYIGVNKRILYAFDITIRNTKSIPIKIMLIDQIPVSRINDIEVEPDELNGADFDRDSGKLTWNIDIKPNESKKIRFTYNVKFPKDKTVVGME